MNMIPVQSSKHRYPVYVGTGLLEKTGRLLKKENLSGRVMVLTQRKIARLFLDPVRKSLKRSGFEVSVHYLPDGETAKSSAQLLKLYGALLKAGLERGHTLAALGGGVVGDLGGFAASTYLRGIAFVNLATTLLAQVDSAIGGKTAINLPEGKNLAGTVYPPRLVISDAAVLKTLPLRQLRASMAEVVKYGMIRDPALFRLLESEDPGKIYRDAAVLKTVVLRSSKIKASVVQRDEFETRGERMILNYGHTFAHAFEKATGYRGYLHGEAVSLGMICAADLAVRKGLLRPEAAERQKQVLQRLHLPVRLKKPLRVAGLIETMQKDKKKKGGEIRFILPVRIGRVAVTHGVTRTDLNYVLEKSGAGA